ncbi:hypothetical protein BC828DRAFT_389528 [Blastocladiella britannica]|nr:hypothetical protein BC828DRAFT_389528 [Blastocladiella britannica]
MSLYHGDVAGLVLEHAAATQAGTLIEALTLLRVLPASEHPGTRTAVFARGFVNPELAVALGHTHLLNQFPSWLLRDAQLKILMALAKAGDVVTLSVFYTEHGSIAIDGIPVFSLTSAVVFSGHVRVLEWLAVTAATNDWQINWHQGIWASAASAGDVDVLEWALAKGYLNLDSFASELRAAAKSGQLVALQWVHVQLQRQGHAFSPEESTVVLSASTEGAHVLLLDWWWDAVLSASPRLPEPYQFGDIVNQALASGNLVIVRWWWAKFESYRTPNHRFGSNSATLALNSGSLEVAEWMWAVAARPDASTLLANWTDRPHAYLISGEFATSLPLVQWWAARQTLRWSSQHTAKCARAGAVGVLDWLFSRPDKAHIEWGSLLAVTAFQFQQQRVLQWYLEHRDELPNQQHPQIFTSFVGNNAHDLSVLDWWESHFGFVERSFIRLGAQIARHCQQDWLVWWCVQLGKSERHHFVQDALRSALLAAQKVWALELLSRTAIDFGVTVEVLVAHHTCMHQFKCLETHYWWNVLFGSPADASNSEKCVGCQPPSI